MTGTGQPARLRNGPDPQSIVLAAWQRSRQRLDPALMLDLKPPPVFHPIMRCLCHRGTVKILTTLRDGSLCSIDAASWKLTGSPSPGATKWIRNTKFLTSFCRRCLKP